MKATVRRGSIPHFKILLTITAVLILIYIHRNLLFPNYGIANEEPVLELDSLDQEDPALIKYIKEKVLQRLGNRKSLSRNLGPSPVEIEKGGNAEHVMRAFLNKTNGVFVESGANNGKFLSNTLPLEVHLNWTGLLIEADPAPLKGLFELGRNAVVVGACLSQTNHSTNVTMWHHYNMSGVSYVGEKARSYEVPMWESFTSRCYPLYSLLKAAEMTEIDYLALDTEDTELAILKTVPWDKVNIKVISVETHPQWITPMREYLTSVGYRYIKFIKVGFTHDQFYIHPSAFAELNLDIII